MTSSSAAARSEHNRTYYEKGGRALILAHKRAHRERNARIIREAREVPCMDCGGTFPYWCMDFDHVGDDKDRNVSTLAARPVGEARLREEMAKCEVVCSNCHRTRTHNRRARA